MKYSKFNITLDISRNTDIIYNSLSDAFIILKKGSWEDCLSNSNKSCYGDLIKGGFIIDDHIDETQLCIEKAREIENDTKTTHIIINPTIDCNFKCWYCYENHVPSKMSNETIIRIKKLIDKSCDKSKKIVISFFGGEPLLYYTDVMLPIIKYAKETTTKKGVIFVTNCTSNGSLFNKKRITELKELNFNFAQITLDGNRDVHNKTRFFANGNGSYDKIIETIKELAINNINVTLRINYTNNNIKSVVDIPSDFKDLSFEHKRLINVSFHRVWQEGECECDDIETAIKAFIDAGFVASKYLLGPYCYGDLRSSVVINYNGDIYKCTAENFEETKREGYIDSEGDIIWENNSLEIRMANKFSNKSCLDCKIMPICHGGCSSKPLKHKDYCIFDFDEKKKEHAVMEKLRYNINFKWKNVISEHIDMKKLMTK